MITTGSLLKPVGSVKFLGMKDCVYFVKKKKKKKNSVIKDEKHVLLHCPRYESLRKELYNSINELCPNFKKLRDDDKFNYLLNSDGQIVKVVARYFYMASLTHSSDNIS